MSHIPVNTLVKRTMDSFQAEFADEKIAELHFAHYAKRRVKNLLKLNETVKSIRNDSYEPMPMLVGATSRTNMPFDPNSAYATAKMLATTRSFSGHKNNIWTSQNRAKSHLGRSGINNMYHLKSDLRT